MIGFFNYVIHTNWNKFCADVQTYKLLKSSAEQCADNLAATRKRVSACMDYEGCLDFHQDRVCTQRECPYYEKNLDYLAAYNKYINACQMRDNFWKGKMHRQK